MFFWTILFYQDYRNHAKSNGIKPLLFLELKDFCPSLLFVYFSNSRFSLRLVTQTNAFEDFIHPFGVVSWVEDFVDFFLSEA